MNPFGRIPRNPAVRRWLAAGVIVLGAWAMALLPRAGGMTRAVFERADEFFYDTYYRLRPVESRAEGDVVIVAVDQRSLDGVEKALKFGWPWPRELWGQIATYAANAGAKAIAFDVLFENVSTFQAQTGDDTTFADAIAELKTSIVFGSVVSGEGKWGPFAPQIKQPSFGAVNIGQTKTYRLYPPTVNGRPSLALSAVKAAGREAKLAGDRPFLLHYYGPHQLSDGKRTFRYISAGSVLGAQLQGEKAAKEAGISPEMFKGKIVLMGTIAAGTYDLKASPLSEAYPGVEVQATAIENLLAGQSVHMAGASWQLLATLLCAAFATTAILIPRRALVKLLGPILAAGAVIGVGVLLFREQDIRWLSPVSPLLAVLLASPAAFSWTYLLENRQRRFMLKALSKIVSPAVAEQLERDPERLALGTVRTQVTVLFTDLADFTNQSEGMDVQQLSPVLNKYLGEMSDRVFDNHGTLDKYIGDAVMCFWNAPLPQDDHAVRACRTALAMIRREREIADELREMGLKKVFTRIGINTTTAAIGFIGSDHLFNYSAIGEGVNLGSRLEGANKLYGTRILAAETTANLAKDQFLMRKIDNLRVKGMKKPMPVYEVLAERGQEAGLEPLARGYEKAFEAYQAKRWDEAERLLLEVLANFAEDGPSRALLKRIEHYREEPPPEEWDGVYVAKEK